MSSTQYTGGCQCGAVRFAITEGLGRSGICHCRMCQKAFGNAFAPLVTAYGLVWTRGAPKYFRSSNKAQRGFCEQCGTPLVYQPDGLAPEVAVCSFDDPSVAPPVVQLAFERRVPWFETLASLPGPSRQEVEETASFYDAIVSYQQPDGEKAL